MEGSMGRFGGGGGGGRILGMALGPVAFLGLVFSLCVSQPLLLFTS